jgi:hypothetical protein
MKKYSPEIGQSIFYKKIFYILKGSLKTKINNNKIRTAHATGLICFYIRNKKENVTVVMWFEEWG